MYKLLPSISVIIQNWFRGRCNKQYLEKSIAETVLLRIDHPSGTLVTGSDVK